MAKIITALGKLSSARQVSDAVGQTLVTAASAATVSVANTVNLTGRVVQSRLEAHGFSSAGDAVTQRGVWGKPFGAWANQGARDGLPGYKTRSGGVVVGADTVVSATDRVGAAFTYAIVDLDGKNTAPQRADIDLYQLMLYGSHRVDPATEMNWQADLGLDNTDATRTIDFGGLDRQARSSYRGVAAHLGAGLVRQIALSDTGKLLPGVRLDYTVVKNHGYTERGAGSLDLLVDRQTHQQLVVSADTQLNHVVDKDKSLSLHLGGGYDVLARRDSVTAAFAGGGPAFTTAGAAPQRAYVLAGAGVNSIIASGAELTARYDVEVRAHYTSQTLSFKLRREF